MTGRLRLPLILAALFTLVMLLSIPQAAPAAAALAAPSLAQPAATSTPPVGVPPYEGYSEAELEAGRPIGIIIGAAVLVAVNFAGIFIFYERKRTSK